MTNKFSVKPDGLFRQNIVLMSGLVTAPIIVAATTVERAIVLVLSFFLMSYTSIMICRIISRKIVYNVRAMLYAVVAAGMFIPTVIILEMLFPVTTKSIMLYIEILTVNSLLLAKTESRFYLEPFGVMALDALFYVVGYAIAAFVIGGIRELLAFGTLYKLRWFDPPMPAAKSPFFGFFLVGIFAAVCRAGCGMRRSKQRAARVSQNAAPDGRGEGAQ